MKLKLLCCLFWVFVIGNNNNNDEGKRLMKPTSPLFVMASSPCSRLSINPRRPSRGGYRRGNLRSFEPVDLICFRFYSSVSITFPGGLRIPPRGGRRPLRPFTPGNNRFPIRGGGGGFQNLIGTSGTMGGRLPPTGGVVLFNSVGTGTTGGGPGPTTTFRTCDSNVACNTNSTTSSEFVCIRGVCIEGKVEEGEICDDHPDCKSNACGLEEAKSSADTICCLNGIVSAQQVSWSFQMQNICGNLTSGKLCENNEICQSGQCQDMKCV